MGSGLLDKKPTEFSTSMERDTCDFTKNLLPHQQLPEHMMQHSLEKKVFDYYKQPQPSLAKPPMPGGVTSGATIPHGIILTTDASSARPTYTMAAGMDSNRSLTQGGRSSHRDSSRGNITTSSIPNMPPQRVLQPTLIHSESMQKDMSTLSARQSLQTKEFGERTTEGDGDIGL